MIQNFNGRIVKPKCMKALGNDIETKIINHITSKVINYNGEWFNIRTFYGNANRNWNGTPLQHIYNYYIETYKNEDRAYTRSAVVVGQIMLNIINESSQLYETRVKRSREYRQIDSK